MTLGLTQPLTEMSTRNISWGGKGDRCLGLTTLPPSCADCLEIWETQPPGTLRACPGLLWGFFYISPIRMIKCYCNSQSEFKLQPPFLQLFCRFNM